MSCLPCTGLCMSLTQQPGWVVCHSSGCCKSDSYISINNTDFMALIGQYAIFVKMLQHGHFVSLTRETACEHTLCILSTAARIPNVINDRVTFWDANYRAVSSESVISFVIVQQPSTLPTMLSGATVTRTSSPHATPFYMQSVHAMHRKEVSGRGLFQRHAIWWLNSISPEIIPPGDFL
jgi:hypothetical protein